MTREASLRAGVWAWAGVSAVALAVVGLIFAAPLLAAAGHASLSFAVYRAFAGLCHQLPERSFELAGHPLAACARCAGVFAGFAAGALLHPLARGLRRTDAPPRVWLALAVLPTALDFALNVAGLWPNTHWSRALTGALAGAGLVFFVLPGIVQIAEGRRRATRGAETDGRGTDVGARVEGTRAAA
ncbi:MAG: DUF2085 domain-containing protein [Acidobacteria bacterium]|nr:DUF2085 domain-containing protein [Acidobacteriota bacterium]